MAVKPSSRKTKRSAVCLLPNCRAHHRLLQFLFSSFRWRIVFEEVCVCVYAVIHPGRC